MHAEEVVASLDARRGRTSPNLRLSRNVLLYLRAPDQHTTQVLAKPTHGNIIRLAPPLVIDDAEMAEAVAALDAALARFD